MVPSIAFLDRIALRIDRSRVHTRWPVAVRVRETRPGHVSPIVRLDRGWSLLIGYIQLPSTIPPMFLLFRNSSTDFDYILVLFLFFFFFFLSHGSRSEKIQIPISTHRCCPVVLVWSRVRVWRGARARADQRYSHTGIPKPSRATGWPIGDWDSPSVEALTTLNSPPLIDSAPPIAAPHHSTFPPPSYILLIPVAFALARDFVSRFLRVSLSFLRKRACSFFFPRLFFIRIHIVIINRWLKGNRFEGV